MTLAWNSMWHLSLVNWSLQSIQKNPQVFIVKNKLEGVPVMAQLKQIRLGTVRLWVQSLASLSGLRIGHFCELWFRLQTWLGSGNAVALV